MRMNFTIYKSHDDKNEHNQGLAGKGNLKSALQQAEETHLGISPTTCLDLKAKVHITWAILLSWQLEMKNVIQIKSMVALSFLHKCLQCLIFFFPYQVGVEKTNKPT